MLEGAACEAVGVGAFHNVLKGTVSSLLRNICIISQFCACACVRETSLLIAGRICYGSIIDRECEVLEMVNLAWDAIILNFLMAVCGLSAVLVTGSVHVRPDGVPSFVMLQNFSARLSALATRLVVRSAPIVATWKWRSTTQIAAEHDLVGPIPVGRRTNPIGGGTRGRGFPEAEDRVP